MCYNRCPEGCSSEGCDRKGDTCKSCKAGLYGLKCLHNCSHGCLEEKCDPDPFGTCTLGCKIGFKGKRCKEKCFASCINEICNETHCIQGCLDGFWGDRCLNSCPLTCVSCHQNSNLGPICEICVNQFYNTATEKDCRHRCPRNCTACSSYDNCSSCQLGYFGPTCRDVCPSHCIGRICNKSDGECTFGDAGQHSQIRCDKDTIAECTEENSSSVIAYAIVGSVVGTVIIMTAVVALFWKFGRNRKKADLVQTSHVYANIPDEMLPSEHVNDTFEGVVQSDAANQPRTTQVSHQTPENHTYEQLQWD